MPNLTQMWHLVEIGPSLVELGQARSGRVCPRWAKFGVMLTHIGRCGPELARFGKQLANFSRVWSTPGQIRPNRDKSGQCWPQLGEVGQIWATLGQIRPNHQIRVYFVPSWADFTGESCCGIDQFRTNVLDACAGPNRGGEKVEQREAGRRGSKVRRWGRPKIRGRIRSRTAQIRPRIGANGRKPEAGDFRRTSACPLCTSKIGKTVENVRSRPHCAGTHAPNILRHFRRLGAKSGVGGGMGWGDGGGVDILHCV